MAKLVSEGAQCHVNAAAIGPAKSLFSKNPSLLRQGADKKALCSLQYVRTSPLLSIRAQSSESSVETLQKSAEKVKLGASDVEVTKIGIGAWSWGDTFYWNNGTWNDNKVEDARAAFNASLNVGITFIDTAEVYGSQIMGVGGESEKLLGRYGS
ncbi:hypothetical protein KP509_06G005500 [Ceratopteris richardii]|uniref:NADP-dependent oxidoreductase domain-containing protein n=1 Tax=Ceratopteris richardii TaxID=49495 RepID=A0A8T2UD64_CERRI|nr:hypothetical protein KP509_06G005500 [Ceratopteris richardii]